jgi:D-lyxose ketol-isomerase
MISRAEYEAARLWAWRRVREAGIPLRESDLEGMDVADLGLGELAVTGLQILTLASTEWVGAKLLILRPHQFFPQHRHPPSVDGSYPGKTEVFRGQHGLAWLYTEGPPTPSPRVAPPSLRARWCTVAAEVRLGPGDQYVMAPNTWHWFMAGAEGAVVWSVSSKVTDSADQFSDPQVVRRTHIVESAALGES